MSRPIDKNMPRVRLSPAEQLQTFVDQYRPSVNPDAYRHLAARTRELHFDFSEVELLLFAALDTPAKVQEFLNTQIYYNYDHSSEEQEETALPPRQVFTHGHAHCFEGAMFAYAVDWLHGHNPQLVLLEASQDPEHNLVVYRDPATGLYGANAHSGWAHLDGRPAVYPTLRAMVETYVPHYISDLTNDPEDITAVGYSEPFDLVAKFGTAWIGSNEPLWDMYYTYVDDTVRFHYFDDDAVSPAGETGGETHLYPLARALKERWIEVDEHGKPFVNVANLPSEGQRVWDEFWSVFDPPARPPRGAAREIQERFRRITGTTPIDLQDNADDFVYFLASGYRIEEIVTRGKGQGTGDKGRKT